MKSFATDELLLLEIKRLSSLNNESAINLLYHHYFERLLAFAKSLVKTKEGAEEVAEDVIIKFWANRNGIAEIQNLSSFLFRAVKNQSLNYIEKEKRHLSDHLLETEARELHSAGDSPLEFLILAEMSQSIDVAVENLPEQCRIIFNLIRVEGFKYKDVADILDISPNTVRNQMTIAIKRICAALQMNRVSHISE